MNPPRPRKINSGSIHHVSRLWVSPKPRWADNVVVCPTIEFLRIIQLFSTAAVYLHRIEKQGRLLFAAKEFHEIAGIVTGGYDGNAELALDIFEGEIVEEKV